MSEERRKVLEMLATGKITAEEAERLLDRLASPMREQAFGEGERGPGAEESGGWSGRREPRYLRVVVDSPDRENVDVRVPLGLIRTGLKLSTMLPGPVARRLSERGIDLGHFGELDDERLVTELAALHVDVRGDDGEKVRVFCE